MARYHAPSSVAKREWCWVNKNQGRNWILLWRRLAIYDRDGFRCVWCGHKGGSFRTPGLTLDHLIPKKRGGSNATRNLATACLSCNRCKSDKTLRQWARALGSDGEVQVMSVVQRARSSVLNVEKAKRWVLKRKGMPLSSSSLSPSKEQSTHSTACPF